MTKKQTGLMGFWNQPEMPGKAEWKDERIRILRHPVIDFEKIGIINDRMFGTVFRNEKECKELLQRILGIHIVEIAIVAQMSVEGSFYGKGIRLDIYAKDENGNVYDIEMQTTLEESLSLRSRYHHSEMDVHQLKKSELYTKLKKSIVIFICTFDLFEDNRCIYTFESTCQENPEIKLDDKRTTVFVNVNGERTGLSEELVRLLDYFKTGIPTDAYTKELQEEVEEARQDDDWRENYMTLEMMMQDKYEKGWEEGRTEGRTESRILLIIKKVQKGKGMEETAEDLEEDISVIKPIYNAVKESAPEYNVEEIYRKLSEKTYIGSPTHTSQL